MLGKLIGGEKLQYIQTWIHGEALHEFKNLCDHIENMITTHLNKIILGLGTYFPPINALYKKNHATERGMRKSHKLKVSCYAVIMGELNGYLDIFPGSKASDIFRETELNEIIPHSMPNGWIRQAYVKRFYFEAVNQDIDMFYCMKISEYIYKGAV